jgi:4-hydroxybenzoate polyprenyltransferase
VTGRSLIGMLRVGDWWEYHLLPLLVVSYTAIAVFAVPADVALPTLLRLMLSIVFVAAYAHAVNDLADAEADARAGKPNRIGSLPVWQRWALCLLLPIGGIAAWAGAGISTRTVAILAGILLLQAAYALRPVRLKERGAWGLMADALHTHALPTLYCCSLFADLSGASLWSAFPLAALVWSSLVGLRGILFHQRTDEANDRRAGVTTFVTTHGSERARSLVRRLVFPAEVLALGVLGLTLIPAAPAIVAACVVYGAAHEPWRRAGPQPSPFADPAPARKGSYVPLLAFYRGWPGVAILLLLSTRDPGYVVLLVVHTLLFGRPLLREAIDLLWLAGWSARAPARVVRRLRAYVVTTEGDSARSRLEPVQPTDPSGSGSRGGTGASGEAASQKYSRA